MTNKLNAPMFQDLLRKGTLNYSIDNIGMRFDSKTFRIGMRGESSILIIKGANDVITGIKDTDEWVLNFNEPTKNVKAYIDLAEPDTNDQVDITMKNEKVIISSGNQKSQLFFCSEHLISVFEKAGPKVLGEPVCEFTLNDDFIDTFNVVKKVASSFGKIYFTVTDGELFMEATDMTNSFANGLKIKVGISEYDDTIICFDFKMMNNIMTILNGDAVDFTFRIGHIKKSNSGLISFVKNDDTEKYYLLSTRENM
jgi:hypothetical protein